MPFAKCAIYLTNIYVVRKEESLPTWERGLKLLLETEGSADHCHWISLMTVASVGNLVGCVACLFGWSELADEVIHLLTLYLTTVDDVNEAENPSCVHCADY